MGTSGKKSSLISSTWLTPMQLGDYFALAVSEINQYLMDVGLLVYDSFLGEHVPGEKARAEGYCAFTPLRGDEMLYVWHRQKTLQLLSQQAGLTPLDQPYLEARAIALDLIQAEKDAARGNDKAYYELFDSIPGKKLPRVMAWALLTAHRACDPIYSRLLESIAPNELSAINRELAHLGADFHLDGEKLPG